MSLAASTGSLLLDHVTLFNGTWYAFTMDGREFYATTYFNPLTGRLELTEVPDPYATEPKPG